MLLTTVCARQVPPNGRCRCRQPPRGLLDAVASRAPVWVGQVIRKITMTRMMTTSTPMMVPMSPRFTVPPLTLLVGGGHRLVLDCQGQERLAPPSSSTPRTGALQAVSPWPSGRSQYRSSSPSLPTNFPQRGPSFDTSSFGSSGPDCSSIDITATSLDAGPRWPVRSNLRAPGTGRGET